MSGSAASLTVLPLLRPLLLVRRWRSLWSASPRQAGATCGGVLQASAAGCSRWRQERAPESSKCAPLACEGGGETSKYDRRPLSLLQLKIREEREAQRARMDGRHEYVLSLVADRLDVSVEEAEEFMLDGDQVRSAGLHTLTHLDCDNCNLSPAAGVRFLFFSWREALSAVFLPASQ